VWANYEMVGNRSYHVLDCSYFCAGRYFYHDFALDLLTGSPSDDDYGTFR